MFSLRKWCLLALSLASVLGVDAKSSTGDSVLVVVDPAQQDSYSIFFNGLKGEQAVNLRAGYRFIPLPLRPGIRAYIQVTEGGKACNY
jgi:oligosaccharyltransferase complex subunit beta